MGKTIEYPSVNLNWIGQSNEETLDPTIYIGYLGRWRVAKIVNHPITQKWFVFVTLPGVKVGVNARADEYDEAIHLCERIVGQWMAYAKVTQC